MKSFKQFLKEAYKAISGTQAGSNPGGLHTDEAGNKHYIKFYKNGDQAKTEALTGQIYKHMGISTVDPKYEHIDGKHAVVTKYNDKIRPSDPSDYDNLKPRHAEQLGKMFHGAVLTKNWDIVGLQHDNIMRDKKGNFHAIDHGGAFHFRAQGGHKDYGPDIAEHESIRHNEHASGHVFGEVDRQHPEAIKKAAESVKSIDDDHVHKLFANSGLENWKEMHKNFQARKQKLIDKYS